ncbi:winged helix-turn-helix transcriptional regulator [Salinigranum sp.]|uniref:winged helix-turn-helix transcriptional regulator n=1 Tax=Salinigranum sp. TaxID=1966351 RepID=UPI003561CD51
MTEPTRVRIRTYVFEHPGVHFSGLVRRLDLAPGQIQYHLRRLVDADAVVRESYYGRTHYYPSDADPWSRGVLALLRRETARDVVFDLLEHGPSRPADVAARVGIARSTLEWHLDHLVEQAVVRKRRDDADRVTLVLERPERTVDLLSVVEPSLPERMVDRFERLVDQLVSDR